VGKPFCQNSFGYISSMNDVDLDQDRRTPYEVIYMTWSDPPDNLRHPRWNYHMCSFSGLGTVSPEDFMARSDVLVIIDEAQLSYSNRTFWLECVKNQAANTFSNVRFIWFGKHGCSVVAQ
jgi:hypothetical protein